jgi:hypothetical protein
MSSFGGHMFSARARIDQLELLEDDMNQARIKYEEAKAYCESLGDVEDEEIADALDAEGDAFLAYEMAMEAFPKLAEEELKELRAQVGIGDGL